MSIEDAALRMVEKVLLDADINNLAYSYGHETVLCVLTGRGQLCPAIAAISVGYGHMFVDYPNGASEFDLADPDFAQHAATLVKNSLPAWSKNLTNQRTIGITKWDTTKS